MDTATRKNERENNSADLEIPSWARAEDGESALANIDDVIATFKKAHERALEKATRQAWLGFFDDSFSQTLQAIATFRQTIAIAMLVRERVVKLIDALKKKAG